MLHFEHHRGRTRGEDIGREFGQIFDNCGFYLIYIVSITTETIGNMNTLGCYLKIKGVIHLYFVYQNIHLCAKLAYKDENIPDWENIMKSEQSLIGNFSSSTKASGKMLTLQKTISPSGVPKKIIQYVTTIWWSTWRILKRLSEISAPIYALIASDQVQFINLTAA